MQHRIACQPATAFFGAKERTLPVLGDAGTGDVLLEVAITIVVGGHRVRLATFFVNTNPAAASLHDEVLDLHRHHCAHTGEGVDHHPDQGAVAQAVERFGVDRIQDGPRIIGRQHRGFKQFLRAVKARSQKPSIWPLPMR
jgi:hypothetical protein